MIHTQACYCTCDIWTLSRGCRLRRICRLPLGMACILWLYGQRRDILDFHQLPPASSTLDVLHGLPVLVCKLCSLSVSKGQLRSGLMPQQVLNLHRPKQNQLTVFGMAELPRKRSTKTAATYQCFQPGQLRGAAVLDGGIERHFLIGAVIRAGKYFQQGSPKLLAAIRFIGIAPCPEEGTCISDIDYNELGVQKFMHLAFASSAPMNVLPQCSCFCAFASACYHQTNAHCLWGRTVRYEPLAHSERGLVRQYNWGSHTPRRKRLALSAWYWLSFLQGQST